MKQIEIGAIVSAGIIDVIDPCYNHGTQGIALAMRDLEIAPGLYKCRYARAEFEIYGLKGSRVSQIGIYLDGHNPDEKDFRAIGEIDVDSGLCGFFPSKPDFSRDGWDAFCEKTAGKGPWLNEYGFFGPTSDGGYTVRGARDESGKIVALEIYLSDGSEEFFDDEND